MATRGSLWLHGRPITSSRPSTHMRSRSALTLVSTSRILEPTNSWMISPATGSAKEDQLKLCVCLQQGHEPAVLVRHKSQAGCSQSSAGCLVHAAAAAPTRRNSGPDAQLHHGAAAGRHDDARPIQRVCGEKRSSIGTILETGVMVHWRTRGAAHCKRFSAANKHPAAAANHADMTSMLLIQ